MVSRSPWAGSPSIPFNRDLIDSLLLRDGSGHYDGRDALVRQILGAGPRRIPASVAPVTGHIAESLAAILLEEVGFTVVTQLPGPGLHGVDLVLLDPTKTGLVAVEVKGTLRQSGWPRLSVTETGQMSRAWLSNANQGMEEWGVRAEDVIGLAFAIALRRGEFRLAATADFASWTPVGSLAELCRLTASSLARFLAT